MTNKTMLIIRREYLERVGKKSFIFTTLLMPLVMLVLMAVPSLIMIFAGSSEKKISVIDHTGVIASQLPKQEDVVFIELGENVPLRTALKDETVQGVIVIPANIIDTDKGVVQYYTKEASSITIEDALTSSIEQVIRDERLKRYNIENINRILEDSKAHVSLKTYRTDLEKDTEEESSTIVSYAVGMIMMILLYMILLLYGQMVMTGIIEEKNNRVLEVIVSSVSPTRLMLGKIVGIALVATTQIVIWMVLLTVMSGVVLPLLLPADMNAEIAAMQAGTLDLSNAATNIDLLQAVSMLADAGYIVMLFVYLLIFLVGGFLLYAAMYAAIGSAVDNIQDASQLQSIIMVPVLLSLVFSMLAVVDPTGTLSMVTSFVPFTSPMVMMARIPGHVPFWEIAVSIVILYASTFLMIWIAAKIYRIGIFMYGKKPGFKDIVAWMKYK